MKRVAAGQLEKLAPLFAYSQETMILSCLQGQMGSAWADCPESPTCAQIVVGDFCFLAGNFKSPQAVTLASHIPEDFSSDILLVIPENGEWGELVERNSEGRFAKIERYAILKEPDCFDREKLMRMTQLPSNFQLVPIAGELCCRTREQPFSRDFCSQFSSVEDYEKRGLGFCVLTEGKLVSGASSYTVYDGGIEIEIATAPQYLRMGLAQACAAKLILECLDRGLYPSWDAANQASVKLAEKLGYHYAFPYITYQVAVR